MPLPILTYSDFGFGRHRIAQNKETELELTAYINEQEKCLLEDLLGCELTELFIADLDILTNLPVTQRFIDIYEPFCLDENVCKGQRKSMGIPEMLKCFVYYYYMRDVRFKATSTGFIGLNYETGSSANPSEFATLVNSRFNEAMRTYKAIQSRIDHYSADYPEYKGIDRDYVLLA